MPASPVDFNVTGLVLWYLYIRRYFSLDLAWSTPWLVSACVRRLEIKQERLKTGKAENRKGWHRRVQGKQMTPDRFCNIFEVTYSTYYPDCCPRHCYWREDFVLCQASYSNHCWSAKSHGGIWERNWNNCKGLTCRRFYNWIGPLQISRNFEKVLQCYFDSSQWQSVGFRDLSYVVQEVHSSGYG